MDQATRPIQTVGPMGRCPQCSKPSLIAPGNPWRPFCSERCKLIDLGDWMNGRFVIPVEPSAEPDDYPLEDLPRQSHQRQ